MEIFHDSQIVGTIVKQIKSRTIIDDKVLSNEELIGLSDSRLLDKPLTCNSILVKCEKPITSKKTINDLYSLQANNDYVILPDNCKHTTVKYNIGDVYHRYAIGSFFIYAIEYRQTGVNYWINYPAIPKASSNRRLLEERMSAFDNDKVLLKSGITATSIEDENDIFTISSIDLSDNDWTKNNVVLSNIVTNKKIKLSKEKLLAKYSIKSINEVINTPLSVIKGSLL